MADPKKISGLEKAAVLLLYLGEDLASEVMKHLSPSEVQKIGSQMTRLEDMPRERLDQVAGDFRQEAETTVSFGGNEYVKKVLAKTLGPDKADAIIDRIIHGNEGAGLDALKWMDPKTVADLIRNEHPQTVAVIMAHLEPEQSSHVISRLSPRLRADVIMRIATMESIAPGAMKELEDTIKQHLAGNAAVYTKSVDGIKTAAEILNQLDTSNETAIISEIEKASSDLAQRIQGMMFVFADLSKVDDRGLQALLKDISNEQLAVAMKAANDALKDKFFNNMSERARDMLKEDIETRGPVKLSEVEKAQQEIVKVARRLEQEGKLVIGGKGGEEVLV
ncbi:MAG: flagellar motor switch protein FliG [Deltaproteobacteria bacterium]|nr:flagellar motor switch protein FliG [Deltaproteobacteria bacterium]